MTVMIEELSKEMSYFQKRYDLLNKLSKCVYSYARKATYREAKVWCRKNSTPAMKFYVEKDSLHDIKIGVWRKGKKSYPFLTITQNTIDIFENFDTASESACVLAKSDCEMAVFKEDFQAYTYRNLSDGSKPYLSLDKFCFKEALSLRKPLSFARRQTKSVLKSNYSLSWRLDSWISNPIVSEHLLHDK